MASLEEVNATMLKKMPSGTPVTGVISVHSVSEFLIEDIFNNGIDLDYEAYIEENGDDQETIDMYEMQEPEILLGFVKGSDGKYDVDKDAEISLIYNGSFNTIQVVRSKYIKMGLRPCSPCFPGQADLDTNDGNLWAWSLDKEDISEYAEESAKQGIFEYVETEEIKEGE